MYIVWPPLFLSGWSWKTSVTTFNLCSSAVRTPTFLMEMSDASGSAGYMKALGMFRHQQAATCLTVSPIIFYTFSCDCHKKVFVGPVWTQAQMAALFGFLPLGTFAKNPQYRVQIPDVGDWKEGDVNMLLSLVQIPRQSQRAQIRSYPVGITLFKVCDDNFVWKAIIFDLKTIWQLTVLSLHIQQLPEGVRWTITLKHHY